MKESIRLWGNEKPRPWKPKVDKPSRPLERAEVEAWQAVVRSIRNWKPS